MSALQTILSQAVVWKLGWVLIHSIWQAAAVAIILAVALGLLRKASANLRYVVSCVALIAMVALPAVTLCMLKAPAAPGVFAAEPMPVLEAALEMPVVESVALEVPVVVEEVPIVQEMPTIPKTPLLEVAIAKLETALPYLVLAWLVGVCGLSLWHLGGWAQLQRLKRQLVDPVADTLKVQVDALARVLRIRQTVAVVQSALVQVPTVVGWLKPMILLPASALTGLSAGQLEALLAHELAHIRRHDYLVNMFQTAIEILGFYHPALWWVSHRIRIERENCCDDIASGIAGDRVLYADALATMEEIRGQRGLAMAASGGSLFARIRRLAGKDDKQRTGWFPAIAAVLLAMAVVVPMTLAQKGNTEAEPTSEGESVTESYTPTEVAARFARLKRRQVREMARENGIPLPVAVEHFFDAVEDNNWLLAHDLFGSLNYDGGPRTGILFPPLLEVYGFLQQVQLWDPHLMTTYANEVLGSLPAGSVYFGGTDAGRFIVTAYRDVRGVPDVFVITQNGLADSLYMQYLREQFGERLWIPSQQDSAQAFQRYVDEVRAGTRLKNAQLINEDGRVSVSDALGVMEMNGILAKQIFDNNKDKHAFYVEESFVIRWMQAHQRPHSILTKLESEPVEITPAEIASDTAFWARQATVLLSDHRYAGSDAARRTYSKLRSTIAGLYASRGHLEAAEKAFREAIALYPGSPEANFGLVQKVLLPQQRFTDARRILEALRAAVPQNGKVSAFLDHIDELEGVEKAGTNDAAQEQDATAPSLTPIASVEWPEHNAKLSLEQMWLNKAGLLILKVRLQSLVPFGVGPKLEDPAANPWGIKAEEIEAIRQGQVLFNGKPIERLGVGAVQDKWTMYMMYRFEPEEDSRIPGIVTFRHLLARSRDESDADKDAYINNVLSDPESWHLFEITLQPYERISQTIPEEILDSPNLNLSTPLKTVLRDVLKNHEKTHTQKEVEFFLSLQPPRIQALMKDPEAAYINSVRSSIEVVHAAIKLFKKDVGRFPNEAEGFRALFSDPGLEGWEGPYIKGDFPDGAPSDAWGTPLRYRLHAGKPIISSAGPDQKHGTDDDIPPDETSFLEFRLADHEAGEGLTEVTVEGSEQKVWLHEEVELTGDDVASARVQENAGQPHVELAFTEEGRQRFAELTERVATKDSNNRRHLAIVVDGKVVSAPYVVQKITSDTVQISGSLTREEAERLAKALSKQPWPEPPEQAEDTELVVDNDDLLKVYSVNRSVADFPEVDDLSTPEAAYATINRMSTTGYNTDWADVSTRWIAARFDKMKRKKKDVDAEWADVLKNARILKVYIVDGTSALVAAELPQKFTSKIIKDPIDVRHLKREGDRWLNSGNDRFDTFGAVEARRLSRLLGRGETVKRLAAMYEKAVEQPQDILTSASNLIERIQNTDYEGYLKNRAEDRNAWRPFSTIDSYTVGSDYSSFADWICRNFSTNPIVSIEFGEVFMSDMEFGDHLNLPAVPYSITLQDATRLEGDLPFYYHETEQRWKGLQGLDWHLRPELIKRPTKNKRPDEGRSFLKAGKHGGAMRVPVTSDRVLKEARLKKRDLRLIAGEQVVFQTTAPPSSAFKGWSFQWGIQQSGQDSSGVMEIYGADGGLHQHHEFGLNPAYSIRSDFYKGLYGQPSPASLHGKNVTVVIKVKTGWVTLRKWRKFHFEFFDNLDQPLGQADPSYELDALLVGDAARKRAQDLKAIADYGGFVERDAEGNIFRVSLVYHEDEEGNQFECPGTSDVVLEYVARLTETKELLLRGPQATDKAMKYVGQMQNLEKLYMWDAQVTDKGAVHLASLRNLNNIHISDGYISDRTLKVLSKLPRLKTMALQGNDFTNRGLKHLRRMTQLEELWVCSKSGRITDASMPYLAQLTNLRSLAIQDTLVTDKGVLELRNMQNLRSLNLHGTAVTDRGVSRLLAALPHLRIDHPEVMKHRRGPQATGAEELPLRGEGKSKIDHNSDVVALEKTIQQSGELVVSIDKNGELSIGDRPITLEALKAAGARVGLEGRQVLIRTHKNTAYRPVKAVTDAMRVLNVKALSIGVAPEASAEAEVAAPARAAKTASKLPSMKVDGRTFGFEAVIVEGPVKVLQECGALIDTRGLVGQDGFRSSVSPISGSMVNVKKLMAHDEVTIKRFPPLLLTVGDKKEIDNLQVAVSPLSADGNGATVDPDAPKVGQKIIVSLESVADRVATVECEMLESSVIKWATSTNSVSAGPRMFPILNSRSIKTSGGFEVNTWTCLSGSGGATSSDRGEAAKCYVLMARVIDTTTPAAVYISVTAKSVRTTEDGGEEIKTLGRPSIMTRSGEEASIQVGQPFSTSVPGHETLTEQEGNTGLTMKVIPYVVEGGVLLKGSVNVLAEPSKAALELGAGETAVQQSVSTQFSLKFDQSGKPLEIEPIDLTDGSRLTLAIEARVVQMDGTRHSQRPQPSVPIPAKLEPGSGSLRELKQTELQCAGTWTGQKEGNEIQMVLNSDRSFQFRWDMESRSGQWAVTKINEITGPETEELTITVECRLQDKQGVGPEKMFLRCLPKRDQLILHGTEKGEEYVLNRGSALVSVSTDKKDAVESAARLTELQELIEERLPAALARRFAEVMLALEAGDLGAIAPYCAGDVGGSLAADHPGVKLKEWKIQFVRGRTNMQQAGGKALERRDIVIEYKMDQSYEGVTISSWQNEQGTNGWVCTDIGFGL